MQVSEAGAGHHLCHSRISSLIITIIDNIICLEKDIGAFKSKHFQRKATFFSPYGACFRAAMCFYASNLSFCLKPFPVHGTPVDGNKLI